ncbi:hypothetical protein [Caulifigura coniformis]|nr:hypothetical protein [Caulifigura coniformis]
MAQHQSTSSLSQSDGDLTDLLERITVAQIDSQMRQCETRLKAWAALRVLIEQRDLERATSLLTSSTASVA